MLITLLCGFDDVCSEVFTSRLNPLYAEEMDTRAISYDELLN